DPAHVLPGRARRAPAVLPGPRVGSRARKRAGSRAPAHSRVAAGLYRAARGEARAGRGRTRVCRAAAERARERRGSLTHWHPADRWVRRVLALGRPDRRLEEQLVHVAPAPVLAGLEAPHDGVVGRMEVLGGVPAWRVVTASDVAALLTQPQVDP